MEAYKHLILVISDPGPLTAGSEGSGINLGQVASLDLPAKEGLDPDSQSMETEQGDSLSRARPPSLLSLS